jgi:hypothetical protein
MYAPSAEEPSLTTAATTVDSALRTATRSEVGMMNAEYYKALLEMYKRGERTINIVALANLRVKHNGGAFWLNNKLDLRDFATIKRS